MVKMEADEMPKAEGGGREFIGKINYFFADLLDEIRKRYKIPNELKAHLFVGYSFGERINKFKFTKVNFEHIEIEKHKFDRFRVDGLVEEKYYKIASVRVGDNYYFIVFTKDLKKFEKDYFKTKVQIKKGLFRILHTCFGSILVRIDLQNSTEPILNKNLFAELTEEIENFKKKESVYKAHNLDYKRGLLLYGLPGNGKTCFIKHLLKDQDAISIMCDAKDEKDIDFVYSFLNNEDTMDYFKVIVLEDIDRVGDSYARSRFLNMIDGIVHLNKVLFIATSNNPIKLDHALTNRPSRFDSLYEIESPNIESRKKLLYSFFPRATNKEMREAIKITAEFRGAHFKEVFLLTQLYDYSMIDAIKRLIEKFKAFQDFTKDTSYLG